MSTDLSQSSGARPHWREIIKSIAGKHGVDVSVVLAGGSKRGRITKIRKEIAIILYEQGKSQEQITRCLKLKNRASIQYYLRTREKAPDAEAPGKVTSFIPG